ncbi:HlyD family efflux transporter periplasmic adaptor subunit [Alteromonadaceae bacterium M269]|nr:HlyD family efflux transporter periplasmic adaptor subunit [Alteromonadaceae bacterium M269]
MSEHLFRSEALEHQKDRLHGEVLLRPSISQSLLVITLVIFVSAVVGWLVTSKYAKKETVSGWLEPNSGIVRVYSNANAGKIKQILVNEGEHVAKDQPLAIINGDRILSNGENLEEKLLREYEKQKHTLERQLSRSEEAYTLRRIDITQQLNASKEDLEQLKKQIETLEKRLTLSSQRSQSFKNMLADGNISKAEFDATLEQELSLQNEKQALQRSEVNQKNRIEQLQNQLLIQPTEYQDEVDTLNRTISDIAQQIAQLHGQRAYIIRASKAGKVTNLQVTEGQQTVANSPLMSIVPSNSVMQAKLLVPVRAAGFIKPNQTLEIRYDAFPYQKFGLYSGQVSSVSDSILLPNEINGLPVQTQEPVYLVNAKLHKDSINAFGQQLSLKSGMTLSADVKLKDRTLLEWLFEPLLSIKGKI